MLKQPAASIKLANVSQVRIKKGKKKYEIVCYPNKVQDWRKGIEKDIDEVVQVPQVFTNVGKGEIASAGDLKASFGTSDVEKVVLEILEKGELQVGNKERAQEQEQTHAKVLQQVVSKTLNPRNKKPYTVGVIEKTLQELGFQYFVTKPVKGQALEAIRLLVEKQMIPIVRARMRIRISDDAEAAKGYIEQIKELVESVESEVWDPEFELEAVIDPGEFRKIDELAAEKSGGGALVEVIATETK